MFWICSTFVDYIWITRNWKTASKDDENVMKISNIWLRHSRLWNARWEAPAVVSEEGKPPYVYGGSSLPVILTFARRQPWSSAHGHLTSVGAPTRVFTWFSFIPSKEIMVTMGSNWMNISLQMWLPGLQSFSCTCSSWHSFKNHLPSQHLCLSGISYSWWDRSLKLS